MFINALGFAARQITRGSSGSPKNEYIDNYFDIYKKDLQDLQKNF